MMNSPDSKSTKTANPTSVDEILQLLQPMGRWQVVIMGLIAFTMFFQSMINLANIFNVYSPVHYCRIPELEQANIDYEMVKNISYPVREDKKGPEGCAKYQMNYSEAHLESQAKDDIATILTDAIRSNATEHCRHGWHYETDVMSRTIITDFDLVCGEQVKVAGTHSVYMAGFFIGSLLAGPLADYLGRKTALLSFGIAGAVFSIAMSFTRTYASFLALRFLVAACNVGGWLACFVLLQEMMTARYRTLVGALFWIPYAVGYTCLSGFAYATRDWMKLNLAISIPLVLYFAFIFIIPESFSWLLINGKRDKAEQQASKAARFNGVQLPDNFSLLDAQKCIKKEDTDLKSTKVGFWSIWVYPVYAVRTINVYFNWLVNSMVYYGLAYQVSSFSGNLFLNNALSGAVEIPGCVVCIPLLMWSRRKGLALTLTVAGMACFMVAIPYSDKLFPLKLFFFLTGRFAITASFGIVYVITSDLYPTVVRTTAQATSSMVARLGSIVAPFILAIPEAAKAGTSERTRLESIPPVIFGIFAISAALLTLLLPETTRDSLPQQLPDGLRNLSRFEKLIEKMCGNRVQCCCSSHDIVVPLKEIEIQK